MKRRGPLRRRKPLRQRSPKRAGDDRAWAVLRARLVDEARGECAATAALPEVECWGVLDGHHILPRSRGGALLDPSNVLVVCRLHHDWIHRNPNTAVERGLLRRR